MPRPAPPSIDPIAITAVLAAVRQAADAICDRWSFEILVAAFGGARRYSEFSTQTGMASRLVASRLRALESLGVLSRAAHDASPMRQDYRMTAMGEALADVLRQMLRWEHRWRAPGGGGATPVSGPLAGADRASLRCGRCGALVTARDITPRLDGAARLALPDKKTAHRRSTLAADAHAEHRQGLGQSLDIFGDKWGIEILICALFRVRRFGEFRSCTGISANILSDRLARLETLGILARGRAGSATPGYWLTEKGLDLYGVTVAVQAWADRWLPDRIRSPVTLVHTACGQTFEMGIDAP